MSEAIERVAQWLDGTLPTDDLPAPVIWACVEIFGHRKHYGRVREVEHFGTKMLRVDVPRMAAAPLLAEEERFDTFFYGGAAIFSFTPMTEESARKWAESDRPGPLKPMDRLEWLPRPDDFDEAPF